MQHGDFVEHYTICSVGKAVLDFSHYPLQLTVAVASGHVQYDLDSAFVEFVHHFRCKVNHSIRSMVRTYDKLGLDCYYPVDFRAELATVIRVPSIINDELSIGN